jgi:hypothetical protein
MRTRIVHNLETGQVEEIEVDNVWILANRPPNIALSIPQNSYGVGQSAQLSAQLTTPELTDFTTQNISENRTVRLQIGDITQTVNLINGVWSDTLNFTLAGTYQIICLDLPSNELIIQVV